MLWRPLCTSSPVGAQVLRCCALLYVVFLSGITARTRRLLQTIIEVEAKSLDDSRNGDGRQATLPISERRPPVHSRHKITIVSNGLLSRQGLTGNTVGDV